MTDDTKAVVESWKPAPGWETRLEVSNLGNIRTIERIAEGVRLGKPISQKRPAKLLSPWIGRSGYRQLAIKVGTRRQKVYLHRLVAMAFVSGYADGLTVNHINGNRLDNRSDNLEWVTLARNTAHQWEIGLVNLRGENHPSHKLSSGQVRIIRDIIKRGVSCNSLAVLIGVSPSLIYKIRDGERWSDLTE